jgi:hypothetical protein
MSWRQVADRMDMIAVGAGPSSRMLEGIGYRAKLVGCGAVSQFLELGKYCYGDIAHFNNIPDCEVYASSRNFNDKSGMLPFPEEFPFAGSAGGMAISIACASCKPGSLVGLVGFDGLDMFGHEYNSQSRTDHIDVMMYWIQKGYMLVSLMHVSSFNNVLLRWDQVDSIMKGLWNGK